MSNIVFHNKTGENYILIIVLSEMRSKREIITSL